MKKTNKRTKRVPFLCLQGTFLCTEGLPVKKKKKKKTKILTFSEFIFY